MKTIEYRTMDKSKWGRGPWLLEPDKKQWQDEKTGLPCLAVRNGGGAWCGYVGVSVGHPAHGKDYDGIDVRVHGGLTFASKCAEITAERYAEWRKRMLARRDEAKKYPVGDAARDLREWASALKSFDAWAEQGRARYICHLPEPSEPDNVWWLGFDCAHSGDSSPAYRERGPSLLADGQYRDLGYVEVECRSLARQLKDMA